MEGVLGYLPRSLSLTGELTVAEVLGIAPVIRAQLLLLDEPTNNLDLVGIGQLESALGAYEGAFVVVSHDERFLVGIGADRWLRLSEGRLVESGGLDSA